MNAYHLILEASAFEKGLGNIKKWCANTSNEVKLSLYIPTFTLKELDFQRYKNKSFIARESLKFIEQVEERNERIKKNQKSNLDIIIEFPDMLDLVLWSEVLELAGSKHEDAFNKLPKRLKNLLKSCIYLCHLSSEFDDDRKWLLVSENHEIQELACICKIPVISVIDADAELSKNMNRREFQLTQNFNKKITESGRTEKNNEGQNVVKTKFDKTVYASRGSGILWAP
ncbi:hypothetical protein TPHA_0B00980 [Tetrapisispora phaffii CBS 4417]|uniref:PIN domain-containing protein n=1 Tax=Tetrapisispora phaffii (strain ATCC 24235 / CBS 4417 / NBRC 1672 / NRRL Y-8282 / UCD 70-5) TaxID=1071381 RepID=G8BQH3_TETPH|nr:hypothetical protein TPHA_0B00980 [Tetrapisispora phaffii CBS 4417]CCE61770.1 hypothetical protein TPHA_0B00980 [Tetrapisispora phaffii CBS 4417]